MQRPVTFFALFVLLAFVVMRLTRFVWLDDLIKEPRTKLKTWLQMGHIPDDVIGTPQMDAWATEHPQALWRRKAYELVECGWCISIWVSGLVIAALYLLTDYGLPLPWLWWPALSGAAVVLLEWTDGEKVVILKERKK